MYKAWTDGFILSMTIHQTGKETRSKRKKIATLFWKIFSEYIWLATRHIHKEDHHQAKCEMATALPLVAHVITCLATDDISDYRCIVVSTSLYILLTFTHVAMLPWHSCQKTIRHLMVNTTS